jgi:hypothetical protein
MGEVFKKGVEDVIMSIIDFHEQFMIASTRYCESPTSQENDVKSKEK